MSGSGTSASQSTDPEYATGIGQGGAGGATITAGGNGLIAILW